MLYADNELYIERNQEISYLQEQFQKKKPKINLTKELNTDGRSGRELI